MATSVLVFGMALSWLAVTSGFRIMGARHAKHSANMMSSVAAKPKAGSSSKGDFADNFKERYSMQKGQAGYQTKPVLHTNFWKLSSYNNNNKDLSVKFFKQFTKLRILTEEEEKVAGKFSNLGFRLTKIKLSLENKLGRPPSDQEWANASNMSVDQLEIYLNIAKRSSERLIEHNVRIVDHWVRRLTQHSPNAVRTISYSELMAEGVVGLTKAAERYDGRGVRFYQYAQGWVRGSLLEGISRLRSGNFLSHRSIKMNNRAVRAEGVLRKCLKRDPTDIELSAALKMSPETLQNYRKESILAAESGYNVVTANGASADSSSMTTWDLFNKEDQTSHENQKHFSRSLDDVLSSSLNPEEQRTLKLRYGLMDGKPRSLTLTAELMCMSKESARLLINSAFEKLKNNRAAEIQLTEFNLKSRATVGYRIGAIAY